MGLIKADSGPDLMSGEHVNVRSDFEGTATLTSKNLLPDPGLKDIRATNDLHRYWTLGHAPRPTHWSPFVRDNKTVKQFARQVTEPLPLRTCVYDIEDELARGAPLENSSRTVDIAPPAMPRAIPFPVGPNIGMPAGYYTMAYGYVTDENWQHGPLVTNPGPRGEAFFLAQGQGVLLPTPPEIPSKLTAIAVFFSEPRADATAALTAPMYEIERFRTHNIKQFVRVVGPFKWRNKVTTNRNHTYVGGRMGLPALRAWCGPSPMNHVRDIIVKLSYSVYTNQGMSMSSPIMNPTSWITLGDGKNSLQFKPVRFPRGTIGWRPEVRFYVHNQGMPFNMKVSEGASDWYAITKSRGGDPFFERDEPASIWVSVPEYWPKTIGDYLKRITRSENDNTGINAPSEILETPTVLDLNTSGLTPGAHQVKTALFVGEEEGPDSPAQKVQVAPGDGLRIYRPLFHNRLDNADLGERNKDDIDIPRAWIIPKPFPANVFVRPPDSGFIRYVDRSNGVDNYEAFKTPLAVLERDENKFLMRFQLDMRDAYTSGRVRVWLEEYNDLEQLINSQVIGNFFGSGIEYDFVARLLQTSGEPSSGNVIAISPNTTQIRCRIQGVGSSKAGARNFVADFHHWGVFEGWGKPTKATRLERGVASQVERDEDWYPHGGYCEIKENPTDGPRNEAAQRINTRHFEDGGIAPWVEGGTTGEANLFSGVTAGAAINGTKGWNVHKAGPTSVGVTKFLDYNFTAASEAAVKWDIKLKQIPTDAAMYLGTIRSDTNHQMVRLQLMTNGDLAAVVTDSNNVATTTIIGWGVEQGDTISVEFYVQGAGTSNGSVKCRVGLNNRNRLETMVISSIVWTGRLPAQARLGVHGNDVAANTWHLAYDGFIVSRKSMEASVRIDIGNYFEYYGPAGTPNNEQYGPHGMRVPVRPGQTYTVSAYVYYEDLPVGTDLLRIKAKDRKHGTVHNFGALVDDIAGDSLDWIRHTMTFTVPSGTRYIEFFGNNLGAGTVKIAGIQMEKGNVATDFDRTNAASGYLTVLFSTRPEGVTADSPTRWLGEFKKVRKLRALTTNNEGGSVSVTWRSAVDIAALDAAAFTSNLNTIKSEHNLLEVRVDMSTTDVNNSPECRSIFVDLERLGTILCRDDGTEYKGGVNVHNVSAVHAPERASNIEMASGAYANAPWGTRRIQRVTFNMDAFHRSTVEEIVREKKQVLELPDERYGIFFEDPPQFEPQPNSRIYGASGEEFFQRETADGVVGWLVSREDLT